MSDARQGRRTSGRAAALPPGDPRAVTAEAPSGPAADGPFPDGLAGAGEWLRRSGLCEGRAVVELTWRSLRRRALVARLDDGTSLFLKHRETGADPSQLRNEADVVALVHRHEALAPYRAIMPAPLRASRDDPVFVAQGLDGYVTLRDHCESRPPADRALLRTIAARLAECHAASGRCLMSEAERQPLLLESPVPTYGHVTPAEFARAVGREHPAFLAVVQPANAALRAARAGWRTDCLVHGDCKDDNIMVRPSPGGAAPDVKFVDWELAGWGDRCWDLGALVGQFVFYWVDSIPRGAPDDFAAWIAAAGVPFETLRDAITELLACYAQAAAAAGDAAGASEGVAARTIQYAGCFLLHRALAMLEYTGTMSQTTYCCAHVGKTLLAAPERGAQILLRGGLPTVAW